MPLELVNLQSLLPAFFLVLCRVSGIMIVSPLYGSQSIPAQLKVGLVLCISALAFPVLLPMLPQELTLGAVLVGMVGELSIGVIIGLGLSIILLATQMAGMMIGQQSGIALASVFDPGTEVQTTVIGEIYFFTATAVFLLLGGHRALMDVLLDSFFSLPVMSVSMQNDYLVLLAQLSQSSMELALRVAGPAMIALLLAKVCLGFLTRTMPQLHLLTVGFAIFVALGVLLSGLGMSNLSQLLNEEVSEAFELIRKALGMS